jgi:hypothetical protein
LRVVTGLARAPALHFLAIGALLFAISSRSAERAPLRAPIVISAERVAEIRDEHTRSLGTPPSPEEMDALIAREADDEMLYREALLLGLDRGDKAVEWRVIEKMEFLYGEGAGDYAESLKRGLALGLQRDDAVVRNGLVTKMKLLAKGTSRSEEPTGEALERELAAYFDRHREDYAQPESYSLTHVFLRGDAGRERDALALRAKLEAEASPPGPNMRYGDPFVTGSVVRGTPRAGLVKMFGEAFAAAVADLPTQRWSDPIRSPYGLHLVWLSEKRAAGAPPVEDVRTQVLQAYRAERQREYSLRMMEEIRAAYEVRVETGALSDG